MLNKSINDIISLVVLDWGIYMKNGKLYVIEGACDGMGKSTQLMLLKERFINEGEEIFTHHFPSYNTFHGRCVEEYLKGNFGSPNQLSPYLIHSLYAQDRAIAWLTILKKEYDAGKVLLMDRYTTSSLLYQASIINDLDKRKEFLKFASDYEYNKLGVKEPDNIIFLYADFDLVTEMRNKRVDNDGIKKDIHEMDLDYMKRVYDNAMFVADYLNWDMIKCDKNNHIRTIDDIHEDVYKLIKK